MTLLKAPEHLLQPLALPTHAGDGDLEAANRDFDRAMVAFAAGLRVLFDDDRRVVAHERAELAAVDVVSAISR